MTITAVKVTRWRCEHCRRSWSSKKRAAEHAEVCWLDPEHRACKTCRHHHRFVAGWCGARPGCLCQNEDEHCDLNLMPPSDDGDGLAIRSDCPGWERVE